MTDFVTLDTDDLGVDRIATSPTAFALYDNLFAFAEKAAGAPVLANSYVVAAMMASNSVGTAAIINANVTAAKLASGTNETDWVAGRNAGVAASAVGSYMFARFSAAATFGSTVAGSNLTPVNANGTVAGSSAQSGTWRCMGVTSTDNDEQLSTLWLRIA